MKVLAAATTVNAHASPDGGVCWVSGSGVPCFATGGPEAFARSVLEGSTVRVLVDPKNVSLVRALWSRHLADPSVTVEVGRHSSVDWSVPMKQSVRHVVTRARTAPRRAASLGGWHPLTGSEVVTYYLAAMIDRGESPDRVVATLGCHPAWPALSFVPHLDDYVTARLLAEILDPRRFVSGDHPDRLARMFGYLGLRGGSLSKPAAARRLLAVSAWKTSFSPPASLTRPGYFLWKDWADRGREGSDVATTRLFVGFLRAAWLDALSTRVVTGVDAYQGLLIPSHFIKDESEAAAFERHVRP